jgi:hypothetical protein
MRSLDHQDCMVEWEKKRAALHTLVIQGPSQSDTNLPFTSSAHSLLPTPSWLHLPNTPPAMPPPSLQGEMLSQHSPADFLQWWQCPKSLLLPVKHWTLKMWLVHQRSWVYNLVVSNLNNLKSHIGNCFKIQIIYHCFLESSTDPISPYASTF